MSARLRCCSISLLRRQCECEIRKSSRWSTTTTKPGERWGCTLICKGLLVEERKKKKKVFLSWGSFCESHRRKAGARWFMMNGFRCAAHFSNALFLYIGHLSSFNEFVDERETSRGKGMLQIRYTLLAKAYGTFDAGYGRRYLHSHSVTWLYLVIRPYKRSFTQRKENIHQPKAAYIPKRWEWCKGRRSAEWARSETKYPK